MAPTAATVQVDDSVQTGLDTFFAYVPNIIGFLVLLLVGYVIAKLVKAVVRKALEGLGVDRHLADSQAGPLVEKVTPNGRPSRLVAGVAFWLVFLYALTAAISALKIPAVTSFMNQVLAYLPNVVAAVAIFVVAAALSTAVVAAVQRTMGDTPTGKVVATVVPGVVMAISLFMILTQLKIAVPIVTITYAAVLGMLALAGALAFGLGGRDVAAQLLQTAYEKSQRAKDQAAADVRTGKQRLQGEATAVTRSQAATTRSRSRATSKR